MREQSEPRPYGLSYLLRRERSLPKILSQGPSQEDLPQSRAWHPIEFRP